MTHSHSQTQSPAAFCTRPTKLGTNPQSACCRICDSASGDATSGGWTTRYGYMYVDMYLGTWDPLRGTFSGRGLRGHEQRCSRICPPRRPSGVCIIDGVSLKMKVSSIMPCSLFLCPLLPHIVSTSRHLPTHRDPPLSLVFWFQLLRKPLVLSCKPCRYVPRYLLRTQLVGDSFVILVAFVAQASTGHRLFYLRAPES